MSVPLHAIERAIQDPTAHRGRRCRTAPDLFAEDFAEAGFKAVDLGGEAGVCGRLPGLERDAYFIPEAPDFGDPTSCLGGADRPCLIRLTTLRVVERDPAGEQA
ncbi:hypothetical protein [Streptomyces sp900129855]|uniref:Uncharacterized protein n=1 Tax=Streptomyces sp. 900129855 TaxID=3155129 RepID=A0ABV2ZZ32_9ACTN